MKERTANDNEMFPNFRAFIEDSGLIDKAAGNLSKQIPRILGQGTTTAVGLKWPPAPIERKLELAGVSFPPQFAPPEDVRREIDRVKDEITLLKGELKRDEGKRKFATSCLEAIDAPTGLKDGHFFAGRLILTAERGGMEWSWRVTPHYKIIDRLPPDPEYVARGYAAAMERIRELAIAPQDFERKLELSWLMARHFSDSDDVPLVDVMRMFQVAGQDEKFWQSPRRLTFKDLPEAAFTVSFVSWRSQADPSSTRFEFVPATLHQTKGGRVFYMPMNDEGTQVRPIVSLRRRSK